MTLTDEEILNIATENHIAEESDDDDDEEMCCEEKVSWKEANVALGTFMKFVEQRSFLSDQEYMDLTRIQAKFYHEHKKTFKQKTIVEIFKKQKQTESSSSLIDVE